MTDRAQALREAGRDIISLSVGEPDFSTPAHVVEATKQALDDGLTRYTPVTGMQKLKEAAARHYRRDLGIEADPARILVTVGGKQAIFEALAATVSEGDEVIVPCPWWVSYPQIVRYAGGTVVPLITHAQHKFRFDPGDLEAVITPRTKWLLLNSPGNPTGAVYPREMLLGIADILRRHPQMMVLSDDIYAPLIYSEEQHQTLAALCPDLATRICTISGVSKSHAMTGFRIGVVTGPDWLIEAMGRLQSNSTGNACSIAQAGAIAAFNGPQGFLTEWRQQFRQRRDNVVAAINMIPGLSTPRPDGAFYCFIDATPLMERFGDDQSLCLHLLEHGVAVVAASAFGGKNGFRISFAADVSVLDEALHRIAKALA
ncbi:pyridoxal phosphate-dependent aminotransferase [Altericroceibacterium spongiae]|uniref:Aminotransferase n=2 Tax=Altericroceibacterium spongiae TaxID=2320269 RepID=A0A420EQ34_9SPHN|nr:pyridoxal phosphate-dependent aminotransferase [Altericroceibacterium spongiae]